MIKKILGILIVGLLLGGCGTSESLVIKGKIYEGMTKKELMKTFTWTRDLQDLHWIGFERYFPESKEEILSNIGLTVYYIFSDVNNPGNTGDGILKMWVPSKAMALENLSAKSREQIKKEEVKKEEIKREAEITEEKKEQVKITSMIDVAKDKCKVIGYEEGTEKFADCTLKLYSQSVELAAKNNQQIVIQGQSSGSNVMTIYDPVRDSNALFKRGQGLINGTCTLGDLSNC
jgi:hypothetical protein